MFHQLEPLGLCRPGCSARAKERVEFRIGIPACDEISEMCRRPAFKACKRIVERKDVPDVGNVRREARVAGTDRSQDEIRAPSFAGPLRLNNKSTDPCLCS